MIFIYFLLERSLSHLGTIVNFVVMIECKACLSVDLNICLGYKLKKIYNFSQNLKTFLQYVTLVCAPKIMTECYILFGELHENLEYLFSFMYRSRKVYVTVLMSRQERVLLRIVNNDLQLRNNTEVLQRILKESLNPYFDKSIQIF